MENNQLKIEKKDVIALIIASFSILLPYAILFTGIFAILLFLFQIS